MEERLPAFGVEQRDGKFLVVSADGIVHMTCGDQRSADHYADLMNKSYSRGYKQGVRDCRD